MNLSERLIRFLGLVTFVIFSSVIQSFSYQSFVYNVRFCLLFVKASKALALSITFLPILGCALGTGILFAALVRAVSYAPDNEDVLFNYTALGFAFIETFAFTLFFVAMIVFIM